MSSIKGLRLFFTAAIMGCGSVAMAQSQIVQTVVDFGTPPTGGGACYGKGICSSKPIDLNAAAQSGTTTTFRLSPNGKVLIMSFSLSELNQKQPDEVQFISAGQSTFTFESEYDFTDNMYAPLNLPSGANINSSTPNNVAIDGDVVTMNFRIAN